MYMEFVRAVTDLGDLGVVLPLAAVLAMVLWRFESAVAAAVFGGTLAACLGIMLLLKLAFISCGSSWQVGISSPSGHASASTMVYGAFGTVCATHLAPRFNAAIVGAVVLLVAAIAASRVAIGAHNGVEVCIGLGVGAAALSVFVVWYRGQPRRRLNPTLLGMLACVGLAVSYGAHVPAEKLLAQLGAMIHARSGACGAEDRLRGV
jgi:membrane-associated phospholipid phosphatase